MESFHRRCARFLTRDFICKLPNGEWIYPSTTEVMKKLKLESIQTYIQQRQKHVEKHLTNNSKPIRDLIDSLDMKINMERVNWWKVIPVISDHAQ
jgi:hypothetical protein